MLYAVLFLSASRFVRVILAAGAVQADRSLGRIGRWNLGRLQVPANEVHVQVNAWQVAKSLVSFTLVLFFC